MDQRRRSSGEARRRPQGPGGQRRARSWLPLLLGVLASCGDEPDAPPNFVCPPASASDRAGAIQVAAGSGTALPLARAALVGRAELAGLRLAASIGSDGAVAALRAGDLEIGLLGRDLRSDEALVLRSLPVARTEVVLAATTTAPLPPLTASQAADVLRGEGGRHGLPQLHPIAREASDTAVAALSAAMPDLGAALSQAVARGAPVAWSDDELIEALAAQRDAVAVIDRGLLHHSGLAAQVLTLEREPSAPDRPLVPPSRLLAVAIRRDAPPALLRKAQALAEAMRQVALEGGAYVAP